MHHIPYNSRKPCHKEPFGAVAAGTTVKYSIVLPRALQCRAVWLLLTRDGDNPEERHALSWSRMQGDDEEWWETSVSAGEIGLYWYRFLCETKSGPQLILHAGEGLGRTWPVGQPGPEGQPWQLTVFDPQFRTPDWLKGGLIYQIFPDRFCASHTKKEHVPADRLLREDWGAAPRWQPDAQGNIRQYDFFGGDLRGIALKLPYLQALGVNCIYLNPIFEAQSNHRYDTADYLAVDPLLGTGADFQALCAAAKEAGIRVILDGAFSHTGADSRYFNKEGRYGAGGAYRDRDSPYYPWYRFSRWPEDYKSWWGIPILPELDEENPEYLDFITGETGVARRWLAAGASGWRLDVADELPDLFLDRFRLAVKQEDPEALILGEVWEDASHKESYGQRRRYLLGGQLDSVMNYPFANALLRFVREGETEGFFEAVLSILEHYPPEAIHTLMNHIGTHDTPRALTYLAGEEVPSEHTRRQAPRLTPTRREQGLRLLRFAATMQFTLPGVPCIYYGDEAGLEGGRDPFNRACFPWGEEDQDLLAHYRALGNLRREPVFRDGGFEPVSAALGCIAYERLGHGQAVLVIANRNTHSINYRLPERWHSAAVLLGKTGPEGGAVPLEACEAIVLGRDL